MKKHLFPILLFFSFNITAQPDATLNARMIDGLVRYRHELIAGDEAKARSLTMLKYLWENQSEKDGDGEDVVDFLVDEMYSYMFDSNINEVDSFYLSYILRKKFPAIDSLGDKVVGDLNLIIENLDLIDLLAAEILSPAPPFQIFSKTDIFEEMEFYGIEDNMKIAELGAGSGTWSLLAGLTFDSLDVYVNEIRQPKINFAKRKITGCRSKKPDNAYHYVLGNKKSTTLEGKNLDKIIVRNSFHHFSQKKEMLASIKKSLKHGGDLYIFDPIKQLNEKTSCRKKMSESKLKESIQKNGFDIIEEKQSEHWGWLLLHCKPKLTN